MLIRLVQPDGHPSKAPARGQLLAGPELHAAPTCPDLPHVTTFIRSSHPLCNVCSCGAEASEDPNALHQKKNPSERRPSAQASASTMDRGVEHSPVSHAYKPSRASSFKLRAWKLRDRLQAHAPDTCHTMSHERLVQKDKRERECALSGREPHSLVLLGGGLSTHGTVT